MCSIVEEDFGDDGGVHAMIEDPKIIEIADEVCKKCNVEKSVIKLVFKESQCRQCFLTYVIHKFKASLGTTKIVRSGSSVLLNFNAGPESTCLLDMIRFSYELEGSWKRLNFQTTLVYVDEHIVTDDGIDPIKRLKRIEEVKMLLEQYPNFKCYYSSISGFINNIPLINEITKTQIEDIISSEQTFLKTLNLTTSLTSRQDFIVTSRNDVLKQVATNLGCKYVFLSDITITLAKRLLSNISLGRGSSVANDVAFCDDHIESVKFIRPIRDISVAEIAGYIKFNNIKTLDNQIEYGSDCGQFASIQNLTSNFVDGLQANFSSTVSTVYRTCGKISSSTEAPSVNSSILLENLKHFKPKDMEARCLLCKNFVDYHNSEALYATEYSRFVSEVSENTNNAEQEANIVQDKAMSAVHGDGHQIKKQLCHGCRNIFIDLDDDDLNDVFI